MNANNREHILICLTALSSNDKTIELAYSLSKSLDAELSAIYIETPDDIKYDEIDTDSFKSDINKVEKYGAQLTILYGNNKIQSIEDYARTAKITKIVIGRDRIIKKWNFRYPTLVEKLELELPNIDIYSVNEISIKRAPKVKNKQNGRIYKSIFISIALLIIATLLGLWLEKLGFKEANIITIYILSVLLTAYLTEGQLYGIFSSVLSVLVFNFFFTNPRFSLQAYDAGYPLTFLIMFAASFLTSSLTTKVKKQAEENARKAYRTEVLLTANRNLQQAESVEDILEETAMQMRKLLSKTILVYSTIQDKIQKPIVYTIDENMDKFDDSIFDKTEQETAMWVYNNNKNAGASTDVFPNAKCLYFAIRGNSKVYAVAGIVLYPDKKIDNYEKSLLLALLGECGITLEKQIISEERKIYELESQQEQLRSNLLRAISHDLRTPLTSISGNADMLLNNKIKMNESQKDDIYNDIYNDSMWLINLVENLLSITRMDNKNLELNMKAEFISEVIEEAINHIQRVNKSHIIRTDFENDMLMAKMDTPLIIQIIINLIDNAIKYTAKGSEIVISTREENNIIYISVKDNGKGISQEAKDRIFNMFYTASSIRTDGRRGLGLGLFLCKSIVEAHHGEISVTENIPCGTIFTFTLAKEEVLLNE